MTLAYILLAYAFGHANKKKEVCQRMPTESFYPKQLPRCIAAAMIQKTTEMLCLQR